MAVPPTASADVIVVGAGPGGSATATHLARSGVKVLLLEKAQFPREKVCGDGLTPRAIKELTLLGIDLSRLDWKRTQGLRIHVGHRDYLMEWPALRDFPNFGMTVRRSVFDHYLADHAVAAGAELLTATHATALVIRRGRVSGVTTKDGRRFEAPLVVAADGSSSRLGLEDGRTRMVSRPLGIAVRAYYRSAMGNENWLDSWLELWDGEPGRSHLLPGYGWSFPLGDGTCNIGMGLPDADRFRNVDLRQLMGRWLATMPAGWEVSDQNRIEPVRGGGLPMGFNRRPVYARGLMLVGDAAGAINPFNGEGISYAMESGRFAAEQIVAAHSRGLHARGADKILAGYADRLAHAWGGYFWLGRLFGRIIAHPQVMRVAAHHGLPIPVVRHLTHRMLAHLADRPARNGYDTVINALSRIAPQS